MIKLGLTYFAANVTKQLRMLSHLIYFKGRNFRGKKLSRLGPTAKFLHFAGRNFRVRTILGYFADISSATKNTTEIPPPPSPQKICKINIIFWKKLSRTTHFGRFRGKKLSRMAHFGKFRGRNFREKGKKPRNRESFFPRKFLPLK